MKCRELKMQTKVKKSQNSEAWAKLDCCLATEINYSNIKGTLSHYCYLHTVS